MHYNHVLLIKDLSFLCVFCRRTPAAAYDQSVRVMLYLMVTRDTGLMPENERGSLTSKAGKACHLHTGSMIFTMMQIRCNIAIA